MSCVLVSSDMTVSSRLRGAAQAAGVPLAIVLSPADLPARLSGQVRLVIFDLSQQALELATRIAEVRAAAPQAKTLAFGPHVQEELLSGAREAGCDVVMTNGQFHREGVEVLRRFAGAAGS